jgi:hypothetical protein
LVKSLALAFIFQAAVAGPLTPVLAHLAAMVAAGMAAAMRQPLRVAAVAAA